MAVTLYHRYQGTVVDNEGNVVPNCPVDVRVSVAGLPLAALKANRAGTGAGITNPLAADSEGYFYFYAADGVYQVRAYQGDPGDPTFERIWPDVEIGVLGPYRPRMTLTADTTFYVRTSGASDPGDNANDGLTNDGDGAWLGIQYGINWICNNVDAAGFKVVLQVADDTTITGGLSLYPVVGIDPGGWGTSELVLRGNTTTPANVRITTTANNCITAVNVFTGWRVEGFEFRTVTSGQCVLADFGSVLYLGKNNYGACAGIHIQALYGSKIEIVDDWTASGSAALHWYGVQGGQILVVGGKTLTFTGSPVWSSAFAYAAGNAIITATGVLFSGTATGPRYLGDYTASWSTGGVALDTFFASAGNSAGSITPAPIAVGGSGRTILEQQVSAAEGLINGKLVASVSGNALTVAIKTYAGNDPSALDPVYAFFRNATATNGDYTMLTIAAATSFVASSGSTLGTANAVASRLWIVGLNDGGTFRLGAINCRVGGSSPTQIVGLNEYQLVSSTAEGGAGGADTAGIFYTGTAVTSKAFRILGFVESTQATAGTWATSPSLVQMFGPGIKKPGDVVQTVHGSSGTSTTTTSSTFQATNLSLSITPTSAANLVKAQAVGLARTDSAATAAQTRIHRGSTAVGSFAEAYAGSATIGWSTAFMQTLDAPNTTSATTYAVRVKSTDNVNTVYFLKGATDLTGTIIAEELMA